MKNDRREETSKYTEDQIIGFINQAEGGMPVKDLPQGRF